MDADQLNKIREIVEKVSRVRPVPWVDIERLIDEYYVTVSPAVILEMVDTINMLKKNVRAKRKRIEFLEDELQRKQELLARGQKND